MDNRRQHERFNLYAQVELAKDGEIVILSVRNLSAGGVFVEAPIGEYPGIKVGNRFEMTISLGDDQEEQEGDDPLPSVACRCVGKIIRRERSNPPGFALVFEQLSSAELRNLHTLIASAPKR